MNYRNLTIKNKIMLVKSLLADKNKVQIFKDVKQELESILQLLKNQKTPSNDIKNKPFSHDIMATFHTLDIDKKTYEGNFYSLSSGSYGDTYLFKDKYGKKSVYKISKRRQHERFMERSDFIREVNALVNLKEIPYIISIHHFGLRDSTNVPIICLEAGKLSFDKHIEKHRVSKTMMFDIVAGMYSMSEAGFWHRDLKPQNIVVMNDNTIRIVDFGISRVGPHEDTTASGNVYTSWYRPPEIVMRNVLKKETKYDSNHWIYDGDKCDIWSIAIVFIDILSKFSRKRVFAKKSEFAILLDMIRVFGIDSLSYTKKERSYLTSAKIKQSYKEVYEDEKIEQKSRLVTILSKKYKTNSNKELFPLLEGMMHPNPVKRLSYPQIISHPFFSNKKKTLKRTDVIMKQMCNFSIQPVSITPRMYMILSDWLYEVSVDFKLQKVTFIQGMAIVRCMLERMSSLEKSKLQLYGCIAMQLSANLYEVNPPILKDWVYISDNAYIPEDFNKEGYRVFQSIFGGNLNVHSVYDELRKECKDLSELNGILTCVALCDTLGLHYEYKSEKKVLNKAIEFYNNPGVIKGSIDAMTHLSNQKKKHYIKQLSGFYKPIFYEDDKLVTQRYFCISGKK